MRKLIFSALLLVLTGGVFQIVKDANFIWRDQTALDEAQVSTSNPMNPVAPVTVGTALGKLWHPVKGQSFTPVAPTVWQGYLSILKPSSARLPLVLHLLNLGVHLANTILVFMILSLLLQGEAAAFLGAALFALHPLQVEPVAYLAAFKFILGAFFSLLALWEYLRHALAVQAARRQARSGRPYAVATISYVLAILCHPYFVAVPIAAWLLAKLLPKQNALYHPKPAAWRLGLWCLLAAPVVFWTIASQQTGAMTEILPLWIRPMVAGDAVSFYLSKLLVPLGIGPDYGRSPLALLAHWWGYLTWLVPVVMLLVIGSRRGKSTLWYRTALLLFIAVLAPVLGLVAFEAQATSTVAGRYAYLALLAPALAFSYAAAKARRPALPMALGAMVLACGWLTVQNLKFWATDNLLWTHALEVNASSPIANGILGDKALAAGDWAAARSHYQRVLAANGFSASIYFHLGDIEREHGELKLAAEYYIKALQLSPASTEIYGRLGATYLALGNDVAARENFEYAATKAPPDADTLRLLGMLHVRQKDYAGAIPYLQESVRLAAIDSPTTAEAHALLGKALILTGQTALAKEHLEAALGRSPDQREANRQLADIYYSQGQFPEAKSRYERALAQGQTDFDLYRNVGSIYLSRKEYSKALSAFNSALSLHRGDPELLKNIGMIYFHLRQYKDATNYFQKALTAAPNLSDPHFFLGDIARWHGKDPEAMHEYQLAIKSDPNYTDAYYRLGNLYLKKEQTQQAIQEFQAGLKTAPTDARLLYGLRQAEHKKDGDTAI